MSSVSITESIVDSASTAISFPGQDTALRSSDGVCFHVYSTVLRDAFPIFRDMFSLCKNDNDSQPVIDMEEPAGTLNLILSALHGEQILPSISSRDGVVAILRVVEKFELSNSRIHEVLKGQLAALVPLKAWSIAVRFNRIDDRRAAAKRWIIGDGYMQDLTELDMVSGRDVVTLINLRQKVIKDVETQMETVYMYCACNPHSRSAWIQKSCERTIRTPFNLAFINDGGLARLVRKEAGSCSGCLGRFNGYTAQTLRTETARCMDNLVNQALENA